MAPQRFPDVKNLYSLLPQGTEGGKEFARVVDLLLFHDARRSGKTFTLFNDAAGDFHGLDSFREDAPMRIRDRVGYQYKFFPSPLSKQHRADIAKSLERVKTRQDKVRLAKWILVTPQDLVESATRADGGDVTWFESLRHRLRLPFDIEHWGHKSLLALFLETPSLCLFYYPELLHDGASRRKTIADRRKRYDDGLLKFYRDIQFVGMSIYKQEATKGVPMEHIYIPLSVVPETVTDGGAATASVENPLAFIQPGVSTVILGDPGSGKSTLLRFLALAGISKPLQQRYKANAHDRLPIIVILRRYTDELRTRPNLSLIDYIQELVQADLNLKSADLEFFECYLESGRAIVFFDGLDELPDSHYKQTVRDRIQTFGTTYPGNALVVTSRIVGYDNPFRFDDKEFNHYRVTKLGLPEMEQFVADWYRFRIENPRERDANAQDLIRILRDPTTSSIRELAENPLLLTIVALVHRVDAVLPDERVVLYQKCTETLLNTWHTWKFRESERRSRGRVERRNRQRMEAVAYWMHRRGGDAGHDQRSVVPYDELHGFLTEHVRTEEGAESRVGEQDAEAEDVAAEFLDFVRRRAGLLIEVGDRRFSFVHLTFQEYLASCCIITNSERDGTEQLWRMIGPYCGRDARWHEVIRLLIGGLKSDDTQREVIRRIISADTGDYQAETAELLGGLLLDGIANAEDRKEQILRLVIEATAACDDGVSFRRLLSILRAWVRREAGNVHVLRSVSEVAIETSGRAEIGLGIVLTDLAIEGPAGEVIDLRDRIGNPGPGAEDLLHVCGGEEPSLSDSVDGLEAKIGAFRRHLKAWAAEAPATNFVAAAGLRVLSLFGLEAEARATFETLMYALALRPGVEGPFEYLAANCLTVSANVDLAAVDRYGRSGRLASVTKELERLQIAPERPRYPYVKGSESGDIARLNVEMEGAGFERVVGLLMGQAADAVFPNSEVTRVLLDAVTETFDLAPREQWWHALQFRCVRGLSTRATLFHSDTIKGVVSALKKRNPTRAQGFAGATYVLIDLAEVMRGHQPLRAAARAVGRLDGVPVAPALRAARLVARFAEGSSSDDRTVRRQLETRTELRQILFDDCGWSIHS